MAPGRQCKFHAPSPPLVAHKLLPLRMFHYTSLQPTLPSIQEFKNDFCDNQHIASHYWLPASHHLWKKKWNTKESKGSPMLHASVVDVAGKKTHLGQRDIK